MTLSIAVLKETEKNETRVAISLDMVKKYVDLGATVCVQKGAGLEAGITDEEFKDKGAAIAASADTALKSSDIVLCVKAPSATNIRKIKKGALIIGMFAPYNENTPVQDFKTAGLSAFSMELVPRITRAQSMDVLSSQSNLAGYKAVLDACGHYGRIFPMMMTAAGTLPPAKVFVMGAGVAGLQAIATARRLGAVVTATDVRPAAKEQVESLGANFIAVENEEFKQAETSGGYAKEMSKAYQDEQAALIEKHIAKQDIVITTALIPGRPAPKLISDKMVKSMRKGSVVVDLAVETGGNCAASKAGEIIEKDGVTVIGHLNVPGRLAADASKLYAKNVYNLVALLIDKESSTLAIDWDDEIVKGIALTKDGKAIHPKFGNQEQASDTLAKDDKNDGARNKTKNDKGETTAMSSSNSRSDDNTDTTQKVSTKKTKTKPTAQSVSKTDEQDDTKKEDKA